VTAISTKSRPKKLIRQLGGGDKNKWLKKLESNGRKEFDRD
jgi:hypothetical protein